MERSAEKESSYIQLAYSAVRVFADDGTLDTNELNFLMGLALADGHIDDDERRVLRNIFDQALETRLSRLTRRRIEAVRRKHSI